MLHIYIYIYIYIYIHDISHLRVKRGSLQVVQKLGSEKVRNFLCAHHKGIKKNAGMNPLILNFFTRWSSYLHVSAALSPIKVKGKFFPVHAVKACRGSRGTAPLSLNLSTRWRRVAKHILTPLCPGGTNPIPFEREDGEVELLFLSELKHRTFQPVA